jgi:hypothetical protein
LVIETAFNEAADALDHPEWLNDLNDLEKSKENYFKTLFYTLKQIFTQNKIRYGEAL